MTREIKFRVWDKDKQCYITEEPQDIEGVVLMINALKFAGLWSDNIEISQYTGLKDKNGKEIYEGDIVRFYYSADTGIDGNGATKMIDFVEFEDGCFYFVNPETGCGAYAYRYNRFCEIIGNIYENPELIKSV